MRFATIAASILFAASLSAPAQTSTVTTVDKSATMNGTTAQQTVSCIAPKNGGPFNCKIPSVSVVVGGIIQGQTVNVVTVPAPTPTPVPTVTAGTLWFVRPDGGTRYSSFNAAGQCDGQANTAYPGSGVNKHCAFNDVRYMWMTGEYRNSAWVMAGGDTLIIYGCAASPYQQNADAPHCRIGWDKATGNDGQNFWCAGVDAWWGCSMPPPPSGTASQHTKILGACAYGSYTCNPVIGYPYIANNLTQVYGGFVADAVMYLNGSKYVDVEGLEITSHNGRCTRIGSPQWPGPCSTSSPVSDFSKWGIITDNTTSNITFQDVYVHGLAEVGIGGPIGGPITLTRVSIDFNAFAGWNFDSPGSPADAPGSSLIQSYVTMVGNGCLEEYPIVHTQFPAKACWDIGTGGFGDAWSGQGSKLDKFTCDHCLLAYNTKDAATGPHTLIHDLRLTSSAWIGNMGQDGKWGQDANSNFLFQNNLVVGSCMRMSALIPGAAQNFNISTGLLGSYLTTFCRASGAVFDYFADAGSIVNFNNNTIVTYQPTIFEPGCNTPNNCASSPYNFSNNLILGYTTVVSPYSSGQAPGLYYSDDASVVIRGSHNLEYGIRNGDGCGTSGNICVDPLLVSEPAQGAVPPESVLDGFNFHPAINSPLIGAGIALSGLTTDYLGQARSVSAPTIGAFEK